MTTRSIRTWGILAAALLAAWCAPAPGYAEEPAPKVKLVPHEIALTKLTGMVRDSLRISDDRHHAAVAIQRDGKQLVAVDDVDGKPFDHVDAGSLQLSPEGKRVAYVAQRGEDKFVVDGTKEQPAPQGITGSICVSPDSAHVAYATGPAGQLHVVCDGVAGKDYQGVYEITASPKGGHVAYIAWAPEGKWIVVEDGKEGPAFDAIWGLIYSADGSRLAYGAAREGKSHGVAGGTVGPACDSIGEDSLTLSADGKHWSYAARHGEKFAAAIDGKESAEYGDVSGFLYSADGQHLVYAARRGKAAMMVADGVEGKTFTSVARARYSPDGNRLAYWARQGENWLAVADGNETPEQKSGPGDLKFTPDSAHWIAVFRGGNAPVFIDGTQAWTYSGELYQGSVTITPDGKHVALTVRSPNYAVVRDGVKTENYGYAVGTVFSPDGTHLAWWTIQNGRNLVVVDGVNAPPLNELERGVPLAWDGSNRLNFPGTAKVNNVDCAARLEIEIQPQ